MSAPHPDLPLQVFRATSGTLVGRVSLGMAVFLIAYQWAVSPGMGAAQLSAVVLVVGVLVWSVLLRPRVVVRRDVAELRNMFSDTVVPLASIDDVRVRQTLNVYVGEQRYQCVGIGRSARSLMKGRGGTTAVGFGSVAGPGDAGTGQSEQGMPYHQVVEEQLLERASQARRDRLTAGPVRREPALPELGALAGAVLLSLLAFFL